MTDDLKDKQLSWVFCHQKPERSFFWKGRQFPVCARCTGIHLGFLSLPIFLFDLLHLNWWISIGLIAPTCIDGLTQVYMGRESNNQLRIWTGLAAGIGIQSLAALVGKTAGDYFLTLLK
jgi:uncharacterized membrane protein